MTLNLLLLMAVSFLPFPTRLVAEAIRDEDAERAAVVFYLVLNVRGDAPEASAEPT